MDKIERMKKAGELYKTGMLMQDIAKELGVHPSTVSKDITMLGLRKKSETITNKILQLHNKGMNKVQISQELGVSKTYVRAVLRDKGLVSTYSKTEKNLIDENTVYAEDRLANAVLEKVMIDGGTNILHKLYHRGKHEKKQIIIYYRHIRYTVTRRCGN